MQIIDPNNLFLDSVFSNPDDYYILINADTVDIYTSSCDVLEKTFGKNAFIQYMLVYLGFKNYEYT